MFYLLVVVPGPILRISSSWTWLRLDTPCAGPRRERCSPYVVPAASVNLLAPDESARSLRIRDKSVCCWYSHNEWGSARLRLTCKIRSSILTLAVHFLVMYTVLVVYISHTVWTSNSSHHDRDMHCRDISQGHSSQQLRL